MSRQKSKRGFRRPNPKKLRIVAGKMGVDWHAIKHLARVFKPKYD